MSELGAAFQIFVDDSVPFNDHAKALCANRSHLNRSQIHIEPHRLRQLAIAIRQKIDEVFRSEKFSECDNDEGVVDAECQDLVGSFALDSLSESDKSADVLRHASWSESARVADQDNVFVATVLLHVDCLVSEALTRLVADEGDEGGRQLIEGLGLSREKPLAAE